MPDGSAFVQDLVVTGFGLVSSAGCSPEALEASLARVQHCLTPVTAFETTGLRATMAGEVTFDPLAELAPVHVRTLERGTQLAVAAARQAMASARLETRATCGVAIGVSGSPQYQNVPAAPDRQYPISYRSGLYVARSTPAFQADILARRFGLGGPRFAFGSASLGGMLALSHAMDLLRARHATAMLVGGGEIQTLANALGMDALGVTSAEVCMPFSAASDGISFGEGAAFFVLEREEDAARRGAEIWGALAGTGLSADAYHDLAPDPSGRGVARAVQTSLEKSGASAGIGWVRACGTGHRDLDTTEAFGLRMAFGGAPPPVTSTEPYFSHVNGVSPLLGLAAVLVAQRSGQAPALPERENCRAGLELTMVEPGPLPLGDCLLTATAFGGTNGAVVVRRAPVANGCRVSPDRIVVAGLGAVSPLGGNVQSLLDGLEQPASAPAGLARRVDDSRIPNKLPGIALGRRDRLTRMAMVAVAEALSVIGAASRIPGRIGLLVGLAHGQVSAYGRFFERILTDGFDITTARLQLQMSRFSLASEIAQAFKLTGYSGAMAPGVHGGVQLLAHGAEVLRASTDLDALVVVAADEWTGLMEALYAKLGLLGNGAAYDAAATGCVGGEGAAAVLLYRRAPDTTSADWAAADWAEIQGTGFAGDTGTRPDRRGFAYRRAIETALERAQAGSDTVDAVFGQGCGWPEHDARERNAVQGAMPNTTMRSVLPWTGMAESAGGLFGAIAAAAWVKQQADRGQRAALVGSSERGSHAAIVLGALA